MDYEALLGLGISDEDRMRALADRLRGRERAADVFALSTIAPIARGAQAEQQRVQDTAKQASALSRARAKAAEASEPNIGKYNPGDYTPESFAEFKAGGYKDPTVLKRYDPFTVGGVRRTGEGDVIVPAEEIADDAAIIEGTKTTAKEFAKNAETWKANETKLLNSIGSARSKADVVRETIGDALPLLSKWTTSYGGLISSLPDTEAKRLRNLLDTIRSNVAFGALQDMRANSPTGGALGNVSNIELDLLGATLGSLDQTGDMRDLGKVLRRILRQNEAAIERSEFAYDQDKARYMGEQGTEAPEAPKATMRWNPETGQLEPVE